MMKIPATHGLQMSRVADALDAKRTTERSSILWGFESCCKPPSFPESSNDPTKHKTLNMTAPLKAISRLFREKTHPDVLLRLCLTFPPTKGVSSVA
mmetsp:Transcript_3781/g.5847  ORF Transcript_3781/g.5847 Transcript_3781/m.5847 type:complete len:96 (+) Transcript_3781:407-694(+)